MRNGTEIPTSFCKGWFGVGVVWLEMQMRFCTYNYSYHKFICAPKAQNFDFGLFKCHRKVLFFQFGIFFSCRWNLNLNDCGIAAMNFLILGSSNATKSHLLWNLGFCGAADWILLSWIQSTTRILSASFQDLLSQISGRSTYLNTKLYGFYCCYLRSANQT
jgi:hypothetical protein